MSVISSRGKFINGILDIKKAKGKPDKYDCFCDRNSSCSKINNVERTAVLSLKVVVVCNMGMFCTATNVF